MPDRKKVTGNANSCVMHVLKLLSYGIMEMEVIVMLEKNLNEDVSREGNCHIRVWSGDCAHESHSDSGDKYLCEICGTIPKLDHEVKPAALPYVSGDYDNLS